MCSATHLIEDVLFRDSAHSYLIQLVDCIAFALLKRETAPTPQVKKYNLHKAFDMHLSGVCLTQASSGDPLGIVRKWKGPPEGDPSKAGSPP